MRPPPGGGGAACRGGPRAGRQARQRAIRRQGARGRRLAGTGEAHRLAGAGGRARGEATPARLRRVSRNISEKRAARSEEGKAPPSRSSLLAASLALVALWLGLESCARILAPPGGPTDRNPPVQIGRASCRE